MFQEYPPHFLYGQGVSLAGMATAHDLLGLHAFLTGAFVFHNTIIPLRGFVVSIDGND